MRNRFHALCPYFAMFPESFAEHWINKLTKPRDLVLDPFCGRGTAPFQALLMGRRAMGNDVNPVAFCITRAKTNAPTYDAVMKRLRRLEDVFVADDWERQRQRMPRFFKVGFSPTTLRQLLYLRHELAWRTSKVDCMIAALVLGSLHGESERSPSYLSNQMPRTISTKPDYSVRFWEARGLVAPRREAFDLIRSRLRFRYESERPSGQAAVRLGDMRDLHRVELDGPVRCVITSPPYLDTTNFEEDQWLRLWFLGGPPKPSPGRLSRDDRYDTADQYWRLIGDMWRTLGQIVDPGAYVVVRIGGKKLTPRQIIDGLEGTAYFAGRKVKLVTHEVSPMQRRQTRSFRPGNVGLANEVDCVFRVR